MEAGSLILKKGIRKICLRNIIFPIIFFVLALIFFSIIPSGSLGAVKQASTNEEIISAYKSGSEFIHCDFDTLYYSNFDFYTNSDITAHYYYSLEDDSCIFILIPAASIPDGQAPSVLKDYSVTARLYPGGDSFKNFLEQFAQDINYDLEGVSEITANFIIDEVSSNTIAYYLIFFITLIVMLISAGFITVDIVYMCKPWLHPTFTLLKKYGYSREEYFEIEQNLKASVNFSNSNLYVTDKYLVEFGRFSVDIIPISNIYWLYHLSHFRHALRHSAPLSFSIIIYTFKPFHRYTIHRKKKDTVTEFETYFNTHMPHIVTEFSEEMHEKSLMLRKAKK